MSFDLIVYLDRTRMPTPEAWQRAVTDAQFPILIDQDFDADTFTGFLPCKYKGAISGFEYYSAKLTREEAIRLDVGSADFSVTFVVHSGHNEMQTALGASSALCVAAGGILVDPQSGETISPNMAIAWASEAIAMCPEDPSDA
jgi:hypothetical protein